MIRTDEHAAFSGSTLADLEELFGEVIASGWPSHLAGDVILALTRGGTWRVRGSIAGFATWGRWGWRTALECPECGEEWWDDETPPLNGCCLAHDMDVQGDPRTPEDPPEPTESDVYISRVRIEVPPAFALREPDGDE